MNNSLKVDLHIHTCYSDGAYTPSEIVLRYKDRGYNLIAITDHDTIDGVAEAVKKGEELQIRVIRGIEFSTRNEDGVEMHILGYGIDIQNPALLEKLEEIRDARRRRNARLIEYLASVGYELTYDELLIGKMGDYIGKPDFGRAMVRRGYIKEPWEIFTPGEYLEAPEAKKIKKDMIDTIEAIRLIRECGGIPVLAHPAKIKQIAPGYGETKEQHYTDLNRLLDIMVPAGLGGIEAYHSDHMWEQAMRYIGIAEERGLIHTKGSDYHGDDFKLRKLSPEMDGMPLNDSDIETLMIANGNRAQE
ncbi:MAG: PHP domain-containing protein [Clostridiales bacterium]|nr:PHP domain-containing protein [Clostridiales bacterium]